MAQAQESIERPTPSATGSEAGWRRRLQQVGFVAFCAFVNTIGWEDLVVVPSVGTVARAVGIAALGVALLAILSRGRVRVPPLALYVAAVYLGWSVLSYFWTLAPSRTATRAITHVQLLVMLWLIWEHSRTAGQWKWIVKAYVFGCSISALGVIGMSLARKSVGGEDRYTIGEFNPNALAMGLTLGVPMAWYASVQEERPVIRWILRGYVAVAVIAVIQTASRGGFVAMLIALLAIPATASVGRRKQAVLFVFLLVGTLFGARAIIRPSTVERIMSIDEQLASGSVSKRGELWTLGLQEIFPNSPILGIGGGAFATATLSRYPSAPRAAHNVFVSVLVEQGAVGFALFAAIFVVLVLSAKGTGTTERRFLYVLLLSWATASMTINWEYRKPTWLVIGVVMACGANRWSQRRASESLTDRTTRGVL